MNRVLYGLIIVLLVCCGALRLATNHYRDNAITYKAQRDKTTEKLSLANLTCRFASVMLLNSMQNTRRS